MVLTDPKKKADEVEKKPVIWGSQVWPVMGNLCKDAKKSGGCRVRGTDTLGPKHTSAKGCDGAEDSQAKPREKCDETARALKSTDDQPSTADNHPSVSYLVLPRGIYLIEELY